MEKRVELNWLLDFYGPLLTPHRRALLRLSCEEDLSLSEIAEQTGITRQGVHDAIRNAQAQLESYEEKLGLLGRYRALERAVSECRASLKAVEPTEESKDALLNAARALDKIQW